MVLGVKGASTAAMEFACETGNVSKQLQGDKERLRKDAEAAKHGSESVKILIQKEILRSSATKEARSTACAVMILPLQST